MPGEATERSLVGTLVTALLLERPNLDSPAAVWLVVQRALADGWAPFDAAEAADVLAEAEGLIVDPLSDGQPLIWQWNLSANLGLLHRLTGGGKVALLEALAVIRTNLLAHAWHVDHFGEDRLVAIRWRFVELLGRLVMDAEPQDWERALIGRPLGEPLYAGPAERLRRRRAAAQLTQAQLADRIGAARSTVARWENGTRRPTSAHARALVGELGGEQADYVSP